MNLSDFLHFDNKVDIASDEIISVVEEFSQAFQVKIGADYIFDGIALLGGISYQAFLKLEENGYDIFTYRLSLDYDQNLFTTRTNGKEIRIKETELYPFVFIHHGMPVTFRSESGDEITVPAQTAGAFCAMNIQSVLKQMPVGISRIEVCPNGHYAFHFTILPEKLSQEKYLLKFRNSLGAFEMLEVTGKAMHAPEFAEENLWQTLTGFNFYEERRSRVKSKSVIQVETGYKERDEFPFILDLIQSDEIYLIYPDGDSFRCHVKADSAQFRHLMTEPTSINLKIRAVIDEEFSIQKFKIPKDENYTPPVPLFITVDNSISKTITLNNVKGLLIEWGDGNHEAGADVSTHTYAGVGIYEIKIEGLSNIPNIFLSPYNSVIKLASEILFTSIGINAFYNSNAITSFIADLSKITQIADSDNGVFGGAFASGSHIELDFNSESFTRVGSFAFNGSKIWKVHFNPNATFSIGSNAFSFYPHNCPIF